MPEKSLTIRVGAKDDASGVFGTIEKSLGNLKGAFGRGSLFKELGEVAAGGGVAIGLTLAGNVLREASAKAIELRDALHDGSKSAGDVAEEMAKSLPVFGSIIAAGRNIRELLTGDEAFYSGLERQAKTIEESVDHIRKGFVDTDKVMTAMGDTITKLRREGELLGMSPANALVAGLGDNAQDQIKKFREPAEKQFEALTKAAEEQKKKLREALAKTIVPGAVFTGSSLTPINQREIDAALTARAELQRQIAAQDAPLEGQRKRLFEQADNEVNEFGRNQALKLRNLAVGFAGSVFSGLKQGFTRFAESGIADDAAKRAIADEAQQQAVERASAQMEADRQRATDEKFSRSRDFDRAWRDLKKAGWGNGDAGPSPSANSPFPNLNESRFGTGRAGLANDTQRGVADSIRKQQEDIRRTRELSEKMTTSLQDLVNIATKNIGLPPLFG